MTQAQIVKKLRTLENKAAQLAFAIADLAEQLDPIVVNPLESPETKTKKAIPKKEITPKTKVSKSGEPPKKRGRPAKEKSRADYLPMLNDNSISETPPKKRGKK